MSPWLLCLTWSARSFPRVSGDEPYAAQLITSNISFSSREWG